MIRTNTPAHARADSSDSPPFFDLSSGASKAMPAHLAHSHRRGSVLILVVALLVLLALMATAYIATVRLDATAAAPQSSVVSLGVSGATAGDDPQTLDKQLSFARQRVLEAIASDLFSTTPDGRSYFRRPGSFTNPADAYQDHTSGWPIRDTTGLPFPYLSDAYLASRAPERTSDPRDYTVTPTLPFTVGGALFTTDSPTLPYWPLISWVDLTNPTRQNFQANSATADPEPYYTTLLGTRLPYYRTGGAPQSNINFRDPLFDLNFPGTTSPAATPSDDKDLSGNNVIKDPTDPRGRITTRTHLIPTTISDREDNPPTPANSPDRRTYPALEISGNTANITSTTARTKFTAADADGDGVADSGLVYLGKQGNLHYYAGVRIVDNAAAINLNTAYFRGRNLASPVSSTYSPDYSPTVPDTTGAETFDAPAHANRGLFRANIGLYDTLLNLDLDTDGTAFTAGNQTVGTSNQSQRVFGTLQQRTSEILAVRNFRLGFSGSKSDLRVGAGDAVTPITDTSTPRAETFFLNQSEAMEFQLARKLTNPSQNFSPPFGAPSFAAFGEGETLALAAYPGLISPITNAALDSRLLRTLVQSSPNYYPTNPDNNPANVQASPNYNLAFGAFPVTPPVATGRSFHIDWWFNTAFNYDDAGATNLRGEFFTGTGPGTLDTIYNPPGNSFADEDFDSVRLANARPLLVTSNAVMSTVALPVLDLSNLVAIPSTRQHVPAINPNMIARPDDIFYNGATGVPIGTAPEGRVHDYRVGLNTARFRDLWRAYWATMADPMNGTRPYDINPEPSTSTVTPWDETNYTPAPQFKTVLNVTNNLAISFANPQNAQAVILQLRSAIAAVNTEDLRDSDENITVRFVTLYGTGGITGLGLRQRSVSPIGKAYVYGSERQAYFTRLFIRSKASTSSATPGPAVTSYGRSVIVELSSPDAVPVTDTAGWAIYSVPQSAPSLAGATLVHDFGGAPIGDTSAPLRLSDDSSTGSADVDTGGVTPLPDPVTVAGSLVTAAETGQRLLLVRPTTFGGSIFLSDPTSYCIIDEIDLTLDAAAGGFLPYPSDPPPDQFNYRNDEYRRDTSENYKMVYPGPRLPGSSLNQYTNVTVESDANPAPLLTASTYTYPVALAAPTFTTTGSPLPNIQHGVSNAPGSNKVTLDPDTSAKIRFPYGGFMRDADVGHVPFFGSFIVDTSGSGSFTADFMVTSTNDLHHVRTNDPDDAAITADESETWGRLSPPADSALTLGYATSQLPGQFTSLGAIGPFNPDWRSRATMYLSAIHNPGDDHLPNMAPPLVVNVNSPNFEASVPLTEQSGMWRHGIDGIDNSADIPEPVANRAGVVANSDADARTPIHGLININTAPTAVLNQLPLAYDGATGEIDPEANLAIAKEIVENRRVYGPFRSIWELNRVQAFRNPAVAANYVLGAPAGLPAGAPETGNSFSVAIGGDNTIYGDYSPDTISGDFEDRNHNVIRLSNLITTRSDSFTAYIVVQAWRPATSANDVPRAVAERRLVMTIDRSQVTGSDTPTSAVSKLIVNQLTLP